MATASDDFNSGTTPSASWTVVEGSFSVGGGRLSGSAGNSLMRRNDITPGAAQYSKITTGNTLNYPGVVCRSSGSSGAFYHYAALLDTDRFYTDKMVNGSQTRLGTTFVTRSSPEDWTLEVTGSSISVKRGTTTEFSTTDSDVAGPGSVGIDIYDSAASAIDAWEGGDLGGAATKAPPPFRRATRIFQRRAA